MFFIFMFLLAGGSAIGIARIAPAVLAVAALYFVLIVPVSVLLWVYDSTGYMAFLERSWRFIAGDAGFDPMIGDCSTGSETNLFGVAAPFLMLFVIAFFMCLVVFGTPVALYYVARGSYSYLKFGQKYEFQQGLVWVARVFGAIIVSGLLMRLCYWITTDIGCN